MTLPQTSGLDLVALAGIAGTLLGTALGAFVTWKVQKSQLEHDDKTRFHDRRLTVYAEFTDSTQKVIAAATTGTPFAQHHANCIKAFEMLRLVASQDVANKASTVHATMLGLIQAPQASRLGLMVPYNNQMATLITGMRSEIGVDP